MFKSYSYIKKESNPIIDVYVVKSTSFIPVLAFIAGLYLFVYKVAFPVAAMHLNAESTNIISPVVGLTASFESNYEQVDAKKDSFRFSELSNNSGIIANSSNNNDAQLPDFFHITIPKLEIENALIETNSENLDPLESLAHYKGSCLPGDGCNSLVYGHSTFKHEKNRYEDGDYSAIFSRLDELNYGDEFYIKLSDKEYRYVVNVTKVALPEEINPLEDPYDVGTFRSSVTLFTCDPPGSTKYRRLVTGIMVK